DALTLFRPREILLPEGVEAPLFAAALSRRGEDWWTRAGAELADAPDLSGPARAAAAAARAYAREMRPGGPLAHVARPAPPAYGERMGLDAAAVATLELFESSDGASARSLCALLDRTRTPLGARALRDALAHPSRDPVELSARWDAIEELLRKSETAQELQTALEDVGDLERRFARVAVVNAGPREVAALAAGLDAGPRVLAAGAPPSAGRIRSLTEAVPDTRDCVERGR